MSSLPGAHPLPPDAKSNDLIFWRTDLVIEQLDPLTSKLKQTGAKFVSARAINLGQAFPDPVRGLIVRDPDGHALELIENRRAVSMSGQRPLAK